jgi:tetratricopeptide (TPR) repeat protein
MLSRRCTKYRSSSISTLLAAALLLCACGGSGTKPDAPADAGPSQAMTEKSEPVAAVVRADIPAAAQTMFEQAVAVMGSGDSLEAELRFKEFALRYPDFPGAYVNLAIIHSNNGNDAAAQEALNAALALNPSHAAALNQQGMLFRKNGKFIEAEAAYLKAVTSSPDYALAHYNLGVLNELYLQRLEEALRHFELYQSLAGSDEQVEKWITDLTRRVAANQRSANVAE